MIGYLIFLAAIALVIMIISLADASDTVRKIQDEFKRG